MKRRDDNGIDAVFGDELPPDNEFAPLQRAVRGMRARAVALPAPAPSAALAEVMDRGLVGERRRTGTAIVVALPQPRRVVPARVRYAIAAAVSAVVLTASLAGAGALPSFLQDPVSRALEQFGIHLPGSDSSAAASPSGRAGASGGGSQRGGGGTDGAKSGSGAAAGLSGGTGSANTTGAGKSTSTTGSPPSPSTTVPTTLPDGTVVVPSLTVEIPGLPPIVVPEITVPLTLPPITLPSITLPPVTLPPLTLPPITLPPITLPPLFP